VAFSFFLELVFLSFLSPFSGVFFLGGILPAKFTGPDWPVRGSSFSWNTGSRVVGKWQGKTAYKVR
jgi:hypothetical protein